MDRAISDCRLGNNQGTRETAQRMFRRFPDSYAFPVHCRRSLPAKNRFMGTYSTAASASATTMLGTMYTPL